MHPRLIHKDRSVCHSKSAWASLHKKKLRDFELPDLFSDNEDADAQETTTTTRVAIINTGNNAQTTNTDTSRSTNNIATTQPPVHTENNAIDSAVTSGQSSDVCDAPNKAVRMSGPLIKSDCIPVHTENNKPNSTVPSRQISDLPEASKPENRPIQTSNPLTKSNPVPVNTENAYQNVSSMITTNKTTHEPNKKDCNVGVSCIHRSPSSRGHSSRPTAASSIFMTTLYHVS